MHDVILFPRRHRGDRPSRQFALARLGFRWRAGLWRRERVALSDAEIDGMGEAEWQRRVHR
jgi:hypothetical protein